ncbi:MAG: phosphate ABC transporter permease PstA [Chloroflexi bacterium]|nr:phosphate ABC transporter permease PstA [Chloroflexota bacterium]
MAPRQVPTGQVSLRATGAVARRQALSRASRWVLLGATAIGIVFLAVLLTDVVRQGAGHLNMDFFTHYPSRFASRAGLRSSIIGSAWVMTITVLFALPVAVGTAVWLEEFAPKGKLVDLVRLNISNLAGVPSIIYGILGLAVFVRLLGLGPSIIAGSLTLALMIAPMTVIATSEAIRQVPSSIRDASLALGATRWQTVWHHVLPNALPGIMTGTILAISRAAGETAALIMVGAFSFIAFDNKSMFDNFTTLPIQIYNWTTRPQAAFQEIAASGIIVLMVAVVALNLVAVLIRERFRKTY